MQQLEIPEDQLTLTDVLLGKGGFGEVYLADYSGVNAAAKVLKIGSNQAQKYDLYEFETVADGEDRTRQLELQANQRKAFFRELQAMTRLKSPHTVQVFGAITSRKDCFVLVMELMPGGDLLTLLRQAGKHLPEVRKRSIMKYICSGMAFLHNRGVVHGDLKSANVLFDSAGTAKVTSNYVAFFCTKVPQMLKVPTLLLTTTTARGAPYHRTNGLHDRYPLLWFAHSSFWRHQHP